MSSMHDVGPTWKLNQYGPLVWTSNQYDPTAYIRYAVEYTRFVGWCYSIPSGRRISWKRSPTSLSSLSLSLYCSFFLSYTGGGIHPPHPPWIHHWAQQSRSEEQKAGGRGDEHCHGKRHGRRPCGGGSSCAWIFYNFNCKTLHLIRLKFEYF